MKLLELSKRTTCYDAYNNYAYSCTWDSWGRWLALGLIIAAFLLFFFLCSCITARRRRRFGQQPYWGTGWAGGNQYGNQPQPQPAYYNNNAAPPYYRGNDQQTGVELPSRPENAYGGYAPPPPGKA